MHWIEITGGVLGGGVLTTVFSRLLPSRDKKLDFVIEIQKNILDRENRIEKLESKIEQQNALHLQFFKEATSRENELMSQIAILEAKVKELENQLNEK